MSTKHVLGPSKEDAHNQRRPIAAVQLRPQRTRYKHDIRLLLADSMHTLPLGTVRVTYRAPAGEADLELDQVFEAACLAVVRHYKQLIPQLCIKHAWHIRTTDGAFDMTLDTWRWNKATPCWRRGLFVDERVTFSRIRYPAGGLLSADVLAPEETTQ